MTWFPINQLAKRSSGEHDESIKTMTEIELLKTFSEAHGVSGHEDEIRSLYVNSLPGGDFTSDGNGSVICTDGSDGPRVMLAAHMDEIGFIVQHIHPNGFLSLVPIGGWWSHTLLSQRVEILTRSGEKVLGVTGSKPPHFLPESERKNLMPVDSIFVDVGATSQQEVETEFGIHLGDPVAPCVPFTHLHGSRYIGKAFDNRAGLAVMVAATNLLRQEGHPNVLLSTATVQEEVGMRGAKTIAASANPDCAIILEAPPADDTPGFSLGDSQGSLGKGAQIRLYDPTAITNPKLAQLAEDTALAEGIPFQLTVRKSGGTDAGALHLSQRGIPCIVIGVPTRYIHSHNGVLDASDIEAATALCVALVKRLDKDTVAGLTRYI